MGGGGTSHARPQKGPKTSCPVPSSTVAKPTCRVLKPVMVKAWSAAVWHIRPLLCNSTLRCCKQISMPLAPQKYSLTYFLSIPSRIFSHILPTPFAARPALSGHQH